MKHTECFTYDGLWQMKMSLSPSLNEHPILDFPSLREKFYIDNWL